MTTSMTPQVPGRGAQVLWRQPLCFALMLALSLLALPVWASAEDEADSNAEQAPAQPPKPCQEGFYRQFDFWLGEWEVTTPAQPQRPPAHNRITAVHGGCAVLEEYTTPGGYSGSSLSFWNARPEEWHQTWIDNQGQPVFQSGGIEDGSMVMREDRGGGTLTRTTWTPRPDGKVRQHWEQSDDAGKTWRTIFDGLYAKNGA